MWCTLGCKFGSHGTTALLVIAKRGLVSSHKAFHRNDGCSAALVENDEKGAGNSVKDVAVGTVDRFHFGLAINKTNT